ncbi:MAG TPA: amylo-alpha-1,6-glucosidase [Candidatus Binataceae bacterium]|nr:amylo-alpha-1,6-glucosidase [Candidatus Binataceae bacterium]
MPNSPDETTEWLETDGLGGFASGTASTIRTRRYHALLLAATRPPGGRMVLVNGVEAWLERPEGKFALTSNRYDPDVIHPDGASHIEAFQARPYPQWRFALPDATRIEHGILMAPGSACTLAYWKIIEGAAGTLTVRPFISGRDYHSLHHENPALNFDPEISAGRVIVHPYRSVPAIVFDSNADFVREPAWFRNFEYSQEKARGLDCKEDLAVPGYFRWDLARGEAWLITSAQGQEPDKSFARIRAEIRQRKRSAVPLRAAADAYIVRRGEGRTIIAGYPWFTDWGRDTFISMRGLCLAAGRVDQAREILLQWSQAVSEGMLPNRFPDTGEQPEFNSVDASLWYAVAVHEFLHAGKRVGAADRREMQDAIEAILEGYSRGTRFGIRMDSDSLLSAGEPGVQLTWMDAKVGDWVVTPRIGKPVEVQALWINALRIGAAFNPRWAEVEKAATESFARRFSDPKRGCLYDVIDADHKPGAIDPALRPNQIFAVGGLPFQVVEGGQAKSIVDIIETRLLTPAGLRTLDPADPNYKPRYKGGVRERDGEYHQGTVWPWLMGPFVEAWIRVRGEKRSAKNEARKRFLDPMLKLLDPADSGHLPEIADGDAPHTARGCPFQAWSVGEALRLQRMLE